MYPCVHCSIIHGSQDMKTSQRMGDWIKEMWHMIEYYSAIRKDAILPFATA